MPLGFIEAHGHSGLLGQGPVSWPMVVAFGMAQAKGSRLERTQRVVTTRCGSSACSVARCLPTRWWLNDDMVFT
jgi:hypothetical protein